MTITVTVYDARGQLTQVREPGRQIDGTTNRYVEVHGKAYNAFGEVVMEIDPRAYDSAGTLVTTEDETTDAGYYNHRTTFLYNSLGKIVEQDSPLVSWTAENGGTASARPTQKNSYDLAGRLLGVQDPNAVNGSAGSVNYHTNTRFWVGGRATGYHV